MYRSIYVPVDNSDHSNRAIQHAIQLGKVFHSKMVGSHVYAAKMHEYRFKQMEYSLPEEYLEENELERQRKIHDSLITLGLKLISESYLELMKKQCEAEGLEFEAKMMDGKHYTEIVKDVQDSKYDLVVIGAMGLGRMRDSQIGAVCDRVTREINRDIWVVKHLPEPEESPRDTILVGIDGSPQSFGALMEAVKLAKSFDKKVECVGVFDPFLHYTVFNGLVGILTEKASRVFKFEEQNQLHEEIIDTGLAQIYRSHLNVSETMAKEQGVEVTKTLLDGKVFQRVLDHVRKIEPWLLILGRIGVHSPEKETTLGSNTDNLLRLCPCDILLTTGLAFPKLDIKAEESIKWTDESEERMTRVPDMVRGIARTAILRLAVEKGHSVITSSLLDEAMDRFMPKQTGKSTIKLAESLAFDYARNGSISICNSCGVTARESNPVKCGVCGAVDFELVTPEMIEQIVQSEGGAKEETTYDGRKLKWSRSAREALDEIEDKYQLRRTRARIEKSARGNKMDTITLKFFREVIEEETGKRLPETKPAETPAAESPSAAQAAVSNLPPEPSSKAQVEGIESGDTGQGEDREMSIVGLDAGGQPLMSTYPWTEDAVTRIVRVPRGFMRDRVQQSVEKIAQEKGAKTIDLNLVEEGVASGRKEMEQMFAEYQSGGKTSPSAGNGGAEKRPLEKESAGEHEQQQGAAPPEQETETQMINEVGVMSSMAELRKGQKGID